MGQRGRKGRQAADGEHPGIQPLVSRWLHRFGNLVEELTLSGKPQQQRQLPLTTLLDNEFHEAQKQGAVLQAVPPRSGLMGLAPLRTQCLEPLPEVRKMIMAGSVVHELAIILPSQRVQHRQMESSREHRGERIRLLGLPVTTAGFEVGQRLAGIRFGASLLTTFINPNACALSRAHDDYPALLAQFDAILCDGIGMVVAARRLAGADLERYSFDYTSLAKPVFDWAAETETPLCLVGGRPGVAEAGRPRHFLEARGTAARRDIQWVRPGC